MSRHNGAVLTQIGRVFGRGTVSGLSEAGLLERFVAGRDEAAFAALVARHGPMVLGVCRRVLRDEHEVEDAFQATFLVLVRRAAAIRDGELVGHWLHGVARRVAVRARANAARRHLHEPTVDGVDHAGPGVSVRNDADDLRAVIDEELAGLPDSVRAPIVLCYLEGLTHEEAATRLGWPVGTVRSRMARGRDRLRRGLSRRGLTADDAALGSALTAGPLASPVPDALLDATVKASLSFATNGAASAAATSAAAVSLAQEVLHAMTLTKISAIGAAVLSGAVVLGGLQTYGRSTQEPDRPRGGDSPDSPSRVAKLESKLETLAARVEELQRENQRLRSQLDTTKPAAPRPASAAPAAIPPAAEGASADIAPTLAPVAAAAPAVAGGPSPFDVDPPVAAAAPAIALPARSTPPPMPAMAAGGRPTMMGGGGMAMGGMPGPAVSGGMMKGMPSGGMMASGSGFGRMMGATMPTKLRDPNEGNEPISQRVGDMIFVTSPTGDRVSVLDIGTGKARALKLSDSKTPRHAIAPVIGQGVAALWIEGPKIQRIAALADGVWYPQGLIEATEAAYPIVGSQIAVYVIGRRVYAFSAKARKWGIVEVAEGGRPQVAVSSQATEFTHDGHLYSFDTESGHWRDRNIDPRAILDAPEEDEAAPATRRGR